MTEHSVKELHELTLTVLLALACPLVLPMMEGLRND